MYIFTRGILTCHCDWNWNKASKYNWCINRTLLMKCTYYFEQYGERSEETIIMNVMRNTTRLQEKSWRKLQKPGQMPITINRFMSIGCRSSCRGVVGSGEKWALMVEPWCSDFWGLCWHVDRPFKTKEYYRFPAKGLSGNVLSGSICRRFEIR